MSIPNGTNGLHHTDNRWLLAEAKSLRELLAKERERRRIAEQEFRRLEDRMERKEG